MKKLGKLKLKNISILEDQKMKKISGGYWPGSGTYNDPYQLPEVVVTACYCAGCIEFEKRNNPHGLSGGDRTNNAVTTPFGEYVIKEFIIKNASCYPWAD